MSWNPSGDPSSGIQPNGLEAWVLGFARVAEGNPARQAPAKPRKGRYLCRKPGRRIISELRQSVFPGVAREGDEDQNLESGRDTALTELKKSKGALRATRCRPCGASERAGGPTPMRDGISG